MNVNLLQIEPIEVMPGFEARFIHTQNATFAYWKVKKGAILPAHSHFHEQVTTVIEGEFELTINGKTQSYHKDLIAVIPSNTMHSGIAKTDCLLLDIFTPIREDYKKLSENKIN